MMDRMSPIRLVLVTRLHIDLCRQASWLCPAG